MRTSEYVLRKGIDGVLVIVADNGIGIGDKKREKIFLRFIVVAKKGRTEKSEPDWDFQSVRKLWTYIEAPLNWKTPQQGSVFKLWFPSAQVTTQ